LFAYEGIKSALNWQKLNTIMHLCWKCHFHLSYNWSVL